MSMKNIQKLAYNLFKIQYLIVLKIGNVIKKYHYVYRNLSDLSLQYATFCRDMW
jgi:hypothetical protein